MIHGTVMDGRRLRTVNFPVEASFEAPPSKSVTHRALVVAALAEGESTIVAPLDAEDTRITRDALRALGIAIECTRDSWHVAGRGGEVRGGGTLFLGDSGTSLRFLLALAALGALPSLLDGSPRLRERPVQELAQALAALGGSVRLGPSAGGLPIEAGGAALRGGALSLPGRRSSQFASALLLIGPTLPGGLDLTLVPPAVSLPYVALSAQTQRSFGVAVERVSELRWRVGPGRYPATKLRVEGDHSSASYFLAAAAVCGGRVRVLGLDPASSQPDARFARILASLGCTVGTGPDWVEVQGSGRIPGFELDLADTPDLGPTIAILGLFAEGPSLLRGVAHLRLKESDRLDVLARNLAALGCPARIVEDSLSIEPGGAALHGGRIVTASDHRIAMAFAIAGLRIENVVLDDAACVAKSYPGFWRELARLKPRAGS